MRFRSADRLEPEHVGQRVTVRRRLRDGSKGDVIGILEAVRPSAIEVRKADGEVVRIPLADIVAARIVKAPEARKPQQGRLEPD